MSDEAINPALILKIKKMMALAKNGGANEGEADNAARMAQKLMMENNISMAQVDSMSGQTQEGGQRKKERRKGNAMYIFQQKLMAACAEVNFVHQEVRYEWPNGHRRAKGYILIGRESNVIATQVLFEYLASTCENLGIAYVGGDNKRRMSIEALSFKEGCADRISERLKERHAQVLAEQAREARERNAAARHPSSSGTALVVVMEDYAQTERDRNEDLRLNKPEGHTARRRLMASRESEISSVVSSALGPHTDIADPDFLMAAIDAAVDAHIANRGWVREELQHEIQWRAKLCVDNHISAYNESVRFANLTPAQKQRELDKQERENRKFWENYSKRKHRSSAGPTRNIDRYAYLDGQDAGAKVGLDKQADHQKKDLLG